MRDGTDVYVFGGHTVNLFARNTVFRYNTVADLLSTLAPTPEASSSCQMCVLNGMLYVAGGYFAASTELSSVSHFDPASGSWTTVAPVSRADFGLFVLGRRMFAAGGENTQQSVEKYDPDTDSWSDVSPMLGNGRRWFCSHSVTSRAEIVEGNLFDMLIAKAEAGRHMG